jgi:isopentenyl-diphosphate delta-isomerase
MSIQNRKKDHLKYTISGQSAYNHNSGFEQYLIRHNPLPELNIDDISTVTQIFERNFAAPIFISSMTGGYAEAGKVNKIIAGVCEELNLPFGVGSQRIMLENAEITSSFSVVREVAPNAFIASNIGGAQLIGGLSKKSIQLITEVIDANAIIVHLNPLQEMIQSEGDKNFRGVLDGIKQLLDDTNLPVIIKETGAGIDGRAAKILYDIGIRYIDVAGSGGTSWAKVENYRNEDNKIMNVFNEWGIPTCVCLNEIEALELPDLKVIASGGIRSSLDIFKSHCLGASFSAIAQPVIQTIHHGGNQGLKDLLEHWIKELKTAMLLTGISTISQCSPTLIIPTNTPIQS